MSAVSIPSRKKSWQPRRQRVSVLAELALRKERIVSLLIALREQHGLTQEGAAHKAGVTTRQWQRWESGDSVPYPRNISNIASAFGITEARFFEPDAQAEDDGASDGGTPEPFPRTVEERVAAMEARLDRHASKVERLLEEQSQVLDVIRTLLVRLTPLLPGVQDLLDEAEQIEDEDDPS